MATVVDGATAFGLLMYCAQELPLGCAHFGTRARAARGAVEEKADNQRVAL